MRLLVVIFVLLFLAGCASIPITEDGLAIGKNTTANINGAGIGSVTNKF